MLTKNVYLVYPAGFHGNYFKWAIESSDVDLFKTGSIPDNPINKSESSQWGGVGTSHKSVRIPTHTSFQMIRQWIVYNQPSIKKVYVVTPALVPDPEESTIQLCKDIADFLIQDPTGIIISINDDYSDDINSYGRINAITKWPTFLAATSQDNGFDAFNCANDINFRNASVLNKVLVGRGNAPVDYIQYCINFYNNWFDVRSKYQPHEMPYELYPHNITMENRYFSLSCKDVVSPEFPKILRDILNKSQLSNNVDTVYVDKVHQDFIDIQPNLQWFDSLKSWEDTGELDSYLQSHMVIQAEILKRILKTSNVWPLVPKDEAGKFLHFYYSLYAESWPRITSVQEFFTLPEYIKEELIASGIELPCGQTWPRMKELDWMNMDLASINSVYQEEKKLIGTLI